MRNSAVGRIRSRQPLRRVSRRPSPCPFVRTAILPRRRLHRSGLCRGCKAELDLAVQVRAVRAELGPEATPEEIAERMKQIAEQLGRRRLTARVRRVMEAVA